MPDQIYDLTKIKEIKQTSNEPEVNNLLGQGWVLLKVTESQFHDTYGALKADVVFTIGNPQQKKARASTGFFRPNFTSAILPLGILEKIQLVKL